MVFKFVEYWPNLMCHQSDWFFFGFNKKIHKFSLIQIKVFLMKLNNIFIFNLIQLWIEYPKILIPKVNFNNQIKLTWLTVFKYFLKNGREIRKKNP